MSHCNPPCVQCEVERLRAETCSGYRQGFEDGKKAADAEMKTLLEQAHTLVLLEEDRCRAVGLVRTRQAWESWLLKYRALTDRGEK